MILTIIVQMELPMSDWFRSVPVALDGLAFAAKVY